MTHTPLYVSHPLSAQGATPPAVLPRIARRVNCGSVGRAVPDEKYGAQSGRTGQAQAPFAPRRPRSLVCVRVCARVCAPVTTNNGRETDSFVRTKLWITLNYGKEKT